MTRFELWKDWYKHCLNHPVYKFLVLIRLAHSPSFEMHYEVMKHLEQYPGYKYSVRDEKPEKSTPSYRMNWGWYAVYILVLFMHNVICSIHGFTLSTWQYWVYLTMLMFCFLSGAFYREKKED